MKQVVIHQPDFLPWLGYFDRLLDADLLIVLDHVQFIRRGWCDRDLIKTREGAKWLSLSLQKAPFEARIKDIVLSPDAAWRRANLNLLRECYRKAPFFAATMEEVERLYAADHGTLLAMNLASLDLIGRSLEIDIPRVLSSEMSPVGKSNDMLIDLLRKVDATHYLSGLGARAYLDVEAFKAAGIEVVWQEFVHPTYPQLHGEFVPNLSAIDALFNCEPEQTRSLLRTGGSPAPRSDASQAVGGN